MTITCLRGRRARADVVFLHGIGGGGACFAPAAAALGAALSLPGLEHARLCRLRAGRAADLCRPCRCAHGPSRRAGHRAGASGRAFDRRHGGAGVRGDAARIGSPRSRCRRPAPPSVGRDGDFQREFLARRLGPLDAGTDCATSRRSIVPSLVGERSRSGGPGAGRGLHGGRAEAPTGRRSPASSPSTAAPRCRATGCRPCCSPASATRTRRRR